MYNSYKIVTVSETQFELIGRRCISAVIINEPIPTGIQKNNHFILAHADAAMLAYVTRHYPSAITGRVVIEFKLVNAVNLFHEFFLTEQSVKEFKRLFCDHPRS